MPMFASTTTSGYRDPLQALSIKALEQRQKDLLTQQAAAPGITPENTQQPVQAFGHIANQLADGLNVQRAERATAARRDNLVGVMKTVDWEKGPTSEQVALMHGADPELAGKILQQMHDNRQNIRTDSTARRGQDITADTSRYSTDIGAGTSRDVANTQAGASRDVAGIQAGAQQYTADSQRASHQYTTDVGARTAANQLAYEQRKPLSPEGQRWNDERLAGPGTPLEGMTQRAFDEANKLKPKDAETLLKLTAADTQKEFLHKELSEAEKALMHPGGINLGPTAFLAQGLTNFFGGTAGNKEKAARTEIYDTAMKRVATTNMADILTGPSTNFELKTFVEVYNNKNIPIEVKREAFRVLIESTKHNREQSAEMMKKLGVTPYRTSEAPGSRAAKAPEAIENERSLAQAAIDQGRPYEAVANAFKNKGFDPGLLKQKAQ